MTTQTILTGFGCEYEYAVGAECLEPAIVELHNQAETADEHGVTYRCAAHTPIPEDLSWDIYVLPPTGSAERPHPLFESILSLYTGGLR